MTWRICSGQRINNHISFFKTGMWSHLSPPSPKKQPHGISALGSTRLSSSLAKTLRLRDKSLEFCYVFSLDLPADTCRAVQCSGIKHAFGKTPGVPAEAAFSLGKRQPSTKDVGNAKHLVLGLCSSLSILKGVACVVMAVWMQQADFELLHVSSCVTLP